MGAPAHARGIEAGAELDALDGGDAEEDACELRLEAVEEGGACAHRQAGGDAFADAAHAVELRLGREDALLHALACNAIDDGELPSVGEGAHLRGKGGEARGGGVAHGEGRVCDPVDLEAVSGAMTRAEKWPPPKMSFSPFHFIQAG